MQQQKLIPFILLQWLIIDLANVETIARDLTLLSAIYYLYCLLKAYGNVLLRDATFPIAA